MRRRTYMHLYIVAVPVRAPRTVTAERRSLLSAIQDACCRLVNKVIWGLAPLQVAIQEQAPRI